MPPRERDPRVSRAFGRALKIARVRADMSRGEVAQAAGLLAGAIGRFERGEREPALSVFMRLARALNVSAGDLLIATEQELRTGRPSVAVGADPLPLTVAAIIVHPDPGRRAVLMTTRTRHERAWSWPGGLVEQGESPEEAVVRELSEELALRGARVVGHLGMVTMRLDMSRWWGARFRRGYQAHFYRVAVDSPEVEIIDHEELSGAEWVTLEQLPEALEPLPDAVAADAIRFAEQATRLTSTP